MNIDIQKAGSKMFVALEGRVDTATAPELEEKLLGELKGISELVFDFEKVVYISSAGLRVLLMAHRNLAYGGTTKVINANQIVREVFEVTGFTEILTIE